MGVNAESVSLKVVDLPGAAPCDIPRMLRGLADEIDAGRKVEDAILVATNADGELDLWFWGMHRHGGFHTVGMLEAAKFKLARESV